MKTASSERERPRCPNCKTQMISVAAPPAARKFACMRCGYLEPPSGVMPCDNDKCAQHSTE
jgi:ribosomal protein S27AE